MSKKIKIANKEEDASVSEDRYGFKGNKKKAFGFDLSNNDQYDIDVLENIEDSREVNIEDDEKSDKKKKVDESQKHNDKKPSIADPVLHDTKINNGKNDLKEDLKDNNIPKADPSGPESHGIQFLNKEDKEEEKNKEKEEESINKQKLHHHKDNFADHDNKTTQGNNSKSSNHLPILNHANGKKDKGDEKTGTVEKIAVNKESTDGYVQSLNEVKPIQFIDEVKDSPSTTHNLEIKESRKEEAKLPKLEQPTGLPLKGVGTKDKTKEQRDHKDIKLQPEGAKKISPLVDEKHIQDSTPVKLPPLPPINKESGDANEIKFILDTFPTHDKRLNSDFGPVPQINLDGQADPQQNERFSNEAAEQTTDEKAKADAEINKDFGENNIFPTVKTEILESKHKFSQPVDISSIVNQDTSAFDEATKANFDQKALNKLQQDREKEVQKVLDGKDQKDLKIEKEHKLHNEKIAKETLKARKDQEKEQDLAKKSVDKHRQDWESENQKVKSDFDAESDKKKKETKASIDSEVQKTDTQINKQVDDANAQVKKHTEEAEQKAKAEKAKADNQPKSFWDRISDAVSDLFDAIKSAINSIFDALRKLVKSVIEFAKKAINKLIDYVRDAVIGLIKAFGEVLKALVKVALAAFPALRDKFIGFIDKAVNAACDAVNAIAEGLKKVVNFLLDALGKVIDMALAFYQAMVNLALDALQMIALGLIKVLKFLSQVGEKLKKFGGLIDSINEVYEHPEILETAAQQTIQPYIDKIPAETEKKLNEGLSAVGLTKHFKGIWKYLAPALSHLASNWWGEAKKMIWFLIWPFAEGSPLYEDAPKLVHLIPQIWKDVWNGDYSKAIDGCLEWMQALNMTLGAFAGWIAIAGVVVGAVIGGVAGAVGGAGVGAIPGAVAGAGAGLELAAAVGEGLLVSMMATEGAVLTKAIYDLMTTKDDENKESTPSSPQTPPDENNNNNGHKPEGPQGGSEQPQLKHYTSGNIKTGNDRIEYAYQRIANSVITLGIMGALFLLGAIGGKIAQGLSTAFKRIAAALDRAAPETMASVRNIASKVSSGVGRVTKPVKDFGEKYGDDFGRGQKWMEGKIDDVKGKFGLKKKGGREGENNNQNENENNQNNQEESKNQNNKENQEQNLSDQQNEIDTNKEKTSDKNEIDNNSENNNSTEKNEINSSSDIKNSSANTTTKIDEKPVDETPVNKDDPTVKENEKPANDNETNPLEEKEPKSEAKDNTPGPEEKPASEKTPEELLDEGLKRQGFKDGDTYPNGFKEKWSDGEYDYEVRIHEAEPQHGKPGNIYRVARRKKGVDANGQGFGWEYGDLDGNWHPTKNLKPGKGANKNPNYNEQAAKDTHIEVPDKKIGESQNDPKEIVDEIPGVDTKDVSDNKNRPLESQSDPVKDVLGPGKISHPEEWNEMLNQMEKAGVEIRFTEPGNEQLAYAPGLREGQPGQLVIDPDASISALRHEFQHFLDDQAIGFGGMKTLFDAPLRYEWEFRAYYEEIKLMREQKRFDVARKLLENLRKEKSIIERDIGPVKLKEEINSGVEVKESINDFSEPDLQSENPELENVSKTEEVDSKNNESTNEASSINDLSGQKYLTLAEEAYKVYSKELPEALQTLDEVVGKYGEVTGRAKRPESAANRLERANKNFNKKIENVQDAVDNTWDALGTRLVLEEASPQTIDSMVADLCEGIKSGKLKVNRVNSLAGTNGKPYLTEAHLQQLREAGASIDQAIDISMKEYDTGYTIGAIYVEYPGGVKGEIQIIGKEVLKISNAEHLPYDAILNKPYLDAYKPEFQSEAKALVEPIRSAAQSLDASQKTAYNSYLNDCYKNARSVESGTGSSSVPLPEGLPKELSIDNLLNVENATKKFKK